MTVLCANIPGAPNLGRYSFLLLGSHVSFLLAPCPPESPKLISNDLYYDHEGILGYKLLRCAAEQRHTARQSPWPYRAADELWSQSVRKPLFKSVVLKGRSVTAAKPRSLPGFESQNPNNKDALLHVLFVSFLRRKQKNTMKVRYSKRNAGPRSRNFVSSPKTALTKSESLGKSLIPLVLGFSIRK